MIKLPRQISSSLSTQLVKQIVRNVRMYGCLSPILAAEISALAYVDPDKALSKLCSELHKVIPKRTR